MPKLKKLLLTTTFGLFVFVSQNAYAGSRLSVQSDQTQMIALTTEPGTVVVGGFGWCDQVGRKPLRTV